MRNIWLTVGYFAVTSAMGDTIAENAKELRGILLEGHRPATIITAPSEMGCTPSDCSNDIDGLTIWRERKFMQRAKDGRIKLIQHTPGDVKDLPEMFWEPLGGFKVISSNKHWGACLEFRHEGIGNSGQFQRWSSVVLAPWKSSVAHRFVGYWAGCDFLAEGDQSGEVMLPIIEPMASDSGHLHIVWNRCTVKRCSRVVDNRSVERGAPVESGALLIHGN